MNAAYMEQRIEENSLTPREKRLIDLSFGGEATDEAFRALTEGLDLDTANQNYLLMLSCLGFAKGWERFPPEMIPRLKGLHRYHQAHIGMGIPWLVQQIRRLTGEGIPVMLLKGMAMRAYYAPGRPRIMYDYDLAVPEGRLDRALELLLENGNTLLWKAAHSVSLKGSRHDIDLHRWIFKMRNEQFSDLWKRAEAVPFHGAEVCVPAREDMFLHLLDTQSLNYLWGENPTRRLQWLYDCRDVWTFSGGLDPERVAARARELHITPRTHIMLRLFARRFPELIDPEELERFFPRAPEYEKLLAETEKVKAAFMKYRGYGYNNRSAMTPVHIWRTLRVEMTRYRYLKPEWRRIDPNINFSRYIMTEYGLDGFFDLKRFFSRFRLFEKRDGGN